MRKNLNGILNGVYGLLCFGLFLVQNGYIVFPGTIENGSFTNEFYPILQVVQLVFAAVGVAVVVYDFRMEKRLDGVARYGCVTALICTLINCMLILFFANIGIFFVGNVIAAVMILAGRE